MIRKNNTRAIVMTRAPEAMIDTSELSILLVKRKLLNAAHSVLGDGSEFFWVSALEPHCAVGKADDVAPQEPNGARRR